MRNTFCIILACTLLLLCTGCGKRPEVVDPPEGSDAKIFPKKYPDLSTDPVGVPIPKP